MSMNAPSRMYIVTAGFGTAVAMWAIGYVSHFPGVSVPGAAVLGFMLACLVAGGVIVGRHAGAGPGGGALVGLVTGLVNLLILGSLVMNSADGTTVPSVVAWLPGSLLASVVLTAVGAFIGRRLPGVQGDGAAWLTGFAVVATVAGCLAVTAGGLVTSFDAGLAVPDWPNSFGSNMFLYPLAKMTGNSGIYYEHAHRLYGSLVGLTTVLLAVTLWISDDRGWLRGLATLAVAMVIGQGVMGGLRVTSLSVALATVHGIFGQVFLATLALIWAFTTRTWREAGGPMSTPRAKTEHVVSVVLVFLVVFQIALGAMYRHMITPEEPMPWPAMAHFTIALLVAIFAYLLGLRAWSYYREHATIRRLGVALLVVMSLQIVLGFAALIPAMAQRADWKTIEAALATAHQANGAIVLIVASQLLVWVRRLLAPEV